MTFTGPAFSAVAVAVIVRAVLAILNAGAREHGEAEGGAVLIRYGLPFRVVALVLLVVPPVGVAALAWASTSLSRDAVPFSLMLAFFLAAGLSLVAEAFGTLVRLTPEGIRQRSPWRGTRDIAWSQVRRVTWSEAARWWVIEAEDGRKMRLSELLSGLSDFHVFYNRHGRRLGSPADSIE